VSSIVLASLAEVPSQHVGDPVKGTLIIDTNLAPADGLGSDPQEGQYWSRTRGLDFIMGPSRPAGASNDSITVYDNWDPPADLPQEDGIIIVDGWMSGDDQLNTLLGLQKRNPLGQLFVSDSFVQSFDVKRESVNNLWGYVERGMGEFRRVVNFTVDRLSMTPGMCRP
jgi:hypothetical protein